MSQPGNGPLRRNHPIKRATVRTAREIDQLDLIEHLKRKESRVADAIVTVLSRADAKTLAAFGVVLDFVASQAAKGNAVNASDLLPRRSR